MVQEHARFTRKEHASRRLVTAQVDAAAFLTCYVSLCRRSASEKAALAAKSFQVTDALRATRARLETA